MTHFQSGLFDSLASLQFDNDHKDTVASMMSVQGEIISLAAPLDLKGGRPTSGDRQIMVECMIYRECND